MKPVLAPLLARLVAALSAAALAAGPVAAAPLTLERVVLVQRHGVRPPVVSNANIAKFAAQAWPDWPVPAGELTPHGGEVVRLMGESLRQTYQRRGLLGHACPADDELQVWADGTDQRTRQSGQILAAALAPGCQVPVGMAPPVPRDPIFGGDQTAPACKLNFTDARAALLERAGPGGLETPASRRAVDRLQSILAPDACRGGKGVCLAGPDGIAEGGFAGARLTGPLADAPSLAEDLLLEYAEGMAPADVGWGRAASPAAIAAVMPVHERLFSLVLRTPYFAARQGAPMAKLVLAALEGAPASSATGPSLGPKAKVVALAGHDANLAYMGALFGLDWTLPDEPDATAPATTLAFELWRDPASGARYVQAVIYYETLTQMRELSPRTVATRPLQFEGCASGPGGACPVEALQRRVTALLPPGCGGA